MDDLEPLEQREIPEPPKLKDLIGPSFILLGLGLGSGEIILWPYLSANYGLGIIWAAVLGITFQFFLNMEIERYTIATGESVFVGLSRKFGKISPIWFIGCTFLPWIWPGITASAATVLGSAFGLSYSKYIGVALLIIMGILLSAGEIVYKTQERIQKAIILVGVPFIFILAIAFTKASGWIALGKGVVGIGEGFKFLPKGIPIATFLGALAYAGAGGTLNLAQSLYAKEKGYGMGRYSSKLTSILKGKKENYDLEGFKFEQTPKNILIFKLWWRRINIEHAIVFWATGAVTILMLSLLSYSTVHGLPNIQKGINFVLLESQVFKTSISPILSTVFLIMVGVMLFGTQFSVLGSTSRIMAENLVVYSQSRFKIEHLPKFFFFFLWLQVLAGVIIFLSGFSEPLNLVITGAVLNAISMFIYSGMILSVNNSLLPKALKPSLIRSGIIFLAFIFYGFFSLMTIYQYLRG